eukprot:Clim_evm29s119 gene=Clim_evmTU29s119
MSNADGTLVNIKEPPKPLGGLHSRVSTSALSSNRVEGDNLILELQYDVRAKVYALYQILDCGTLTESMTVSEKMVCVGIDLFLDFKVGEIWSDISEELRREGLRPTTPDQECLDTIFGSCHQKAQNLLERQKLLLEGKADEDH